MLAYKQAPSKDIETYYQTLLLLKTKQGTVFLWKSVAFKILHLISA